MRLGRTARAHGYSLKHFGEVGSTNDLALAAGRAGGEQNCWFVADSQTIGRGRQGRPWVSPKGNFYGSLLLVDPCAPAQSPQLGFVAGVALAQAIKALVGTDVDVGLKWPNDVIANGAKLSGMLLEGAHVPGRGLCVALGIGVNCQSSPELPAYPTTNLEMLRPGSGSREALLEALSDAFAHWRNVWGRGAQFAAIRDAWLGQCRTLGRPIRVNTQGALLAGTFKTIDSEGRLVIVADDGATLALEAGDVLI